jgi:pyruvate dehydrogenase E2 component (dihydrolipoamide acetyltransferase)
MDVLMPQLGETVAEGTITKWFKATGDVVKPGDDLFEIETDKSSMEVPATFGGVLSDIRVQVGDVAKVGAVVAVITNESERTNAQTSGVASPPIAPSPGASTFAAASVAKSFRQPRKPVEFGDVFHDVRTPEHNFGPARLASGVIITPLARRLATERGIDLSHLTGSGPHGRIVAKDIDGSVQPSGSIVASSPSAAQVHSLFEGVPHEEVPLDGMRRTIAKRLTEAKRTIPHFYLSIDIEIGRLLALREDANADAPQGADGKPAYRLSINDFIIKAWALALRRVPAANAIWAEDRILRFVAADIGVAVAIDGGVITPVVRDADTKPLSALSSEIKSLADRARDKKLNPSEYRGGSSAISNLGMYGVREFSAIINPPQATILAVGASRRAPVESSDGSLRFVSQMTVTLSCDHRVVDGVLGAQVLTAFKSVIEKPLTFLI